MLGRDYEFWMDGIHATNLAEISQNPDDLDDGRFWVVLATFEGEITLARFSDVAIGDFGNRSWETLHGTWSTSLNDDEYISYVERVRQSISEGDVYQVNACRELRHSLAADIKLDGLFTKILTENPSSRAAYAALPTIEIASATPERFLTRRGRELLTSPIKGTIGLNESEFGEKDKAENLMIVDLMRNDLSKVCEPGTVEVSQLFRNELHPGLKHLVSDVRGQLKAGTTWREIFEATIPPGSVSGAPKSSALEIISSHENNRGPYCGVIGWVHGDRADLSVAIRTFWKSNDGYLRFGTGAGITWASNARAEWEETQLKAAKLISIAGGELP